MNSRGLDFTGIIQSVFHLFKGKLNSICAGPCDGFVLKMHYRWTFYFTIGSFMTVWYGWYFVKNIHCVSSFNGDKEARIDYSNICLSYPYVMTENGEKRFLLFYRWIHWSFLLLSLIYYLPKKISKSIEDLKAKKILEDLTTLSPRYDQTEKEAVQRAFIYMITNMRTQNSLYYKYLGLNVFALLIDVSVLRFFDFVLHDRFISFVPSAYPFHRDPVNFKDFISQTFPPFAFCIVGKEHKIIPGRIEEIGCHLTNMELYEKLFFIFWFLLYALIIVTLFHILYLMMMLIPSLQTKFIHPSKPLQAPQPVRLILSNTLRNLRVGDVYMLYRLKQHLSPARFYELLFKLGDPKLAAVPPKVNEPQKDNAGNQYYAEKTDDIALRNRHPSEVQQPYNPKYSNPNRDTSNGKHKLPATQLQRLLLDPRNSEIVKLYPKLLDSNGLKDTSILIE